jgi:hypothetical protein
MKNSTHKTAIYTVIISLALMGSATAPQTARAGFLNNAIGGAVLGGLVGGRRGARTGAIIGGIAGAATESSHRRKAKQQQQAYYNRQQAELQQAQQERFQMERARNRALEQQAAVNSPQGKIIKQTQSALTLMGFDVGVADGQLDQATIDAIRAYQNSYKLLATGQPSEELLAHMRDNL